MNSLPSLLMPRMPAPSAAPAATAGRVPSPATPSLSELRERLERQPTACLHARRAGSLARRAGADDALVTAAVLHDIGHLLMAAEDDGSARHGDDAHETLGAALLRRSFPRRVSEPVRLHVMAKRFLATDALYLATLSDAQRRRLAEQGGPLDAAGAAEFFTHPYAADALRLRRWDDAARSVPAEPLPLAELWDVVERCRLGA